MKRGLSASYRFPDGYNMANTAKLTNSMNSTYLKSFNQWGGVSYADILSNYPQEIIDSCWQNLSRFILENYQSGKGTIIKGFGTFTFTNVEYSLEGTTNQYYRDLKRRNPIFIVSNEFVEYLKPGIYSNKSGLLYYTQKKNNSVPIVKVNYSKISYGINISKEECFTIISNTFKLMGDQIRRGEYYPKYMPDLGELLLRGHIFGMRFEPNLFQNLSQKTQKLIHTKKNLRLYMETKDSEGIRHLNIEDIDKAERDIRPKKAVLTRISPSGDEWLQKNLRIDVKKDIKDEPREDLYLNQALNKKEFYVDQRDYRNYPLQNLYGLQIPQDILEGIYNSKYLLLRNMKKIDRHGDGLIPKYDFIYCFKDTNCHHLLRTELIEKITDVYINNNPDIIMIHYNRLINALCDDIKNIVENEYRNFPIEKYRYTIPKNNKRAKSAYAYSKDTGNLQNKAISSLKTYSNLVDIDEKEIINDIDKIGRLGKFLLKENKNNKMISYLGLISMLKKHKLFINKVQMIKILKFLDIKNPNAFLLNDIINKINHHLMNSTNYNTFDNKSKKPKNNNLRNKNKIIKKNNYINDDFVINAIQIIKDRIFERGKEIDEINRYFDHLLSYNICRRANIIYPDELERLLLLEQYDFTPEEINRIFNYMDTKRDGFIDRIEFINAFRAIPHPVSTIYDYIKKNNLSIGDIAYKMGIDLYNINEYEDISKNLIDRLNFRVKIKALNNKFEDDFIDSLFSFIGPKGVTKVITVDELLNFFNNNQYYDDTYKRLYEIKNKSLDLCQKIIPTCVSFDEIKNKFLEIDPKISGKVHINDFFNIFDFYLKNQISDEDIINVLRANRFIDDKDYVNYHKFLLLIYLEHVEDKFEQCLKEFERFLHEECGDDLFIFMVKINNIPNDKNIQKTVNMQRLYEFFRLRVDMLSFNTMYKFDYDRDGIISMDDLKNIIINYIDKNFFEKYNPNIGIYNNYNFDENKKIYLSIKNALNKLNMTENNLFYYLDNNKDGYIDIFEFRNQIFKLPLDRKYTQKQIDLFYTFLDDFNNGKVDINIFQNKLRIIKDYINAHNENGYIGNPTIENLILTEFYKFYKKNRKLSDTEIFSILDKDHDGIISINDMKNFCIKNLFISSHELDDDIIVRFIEAVSLTNNRNFVLADIQNLMKYFDNDDLDLIRNNIIHYCNESVNINAKNEDNKEWIDNVIKKIGMFINEEYGNDIKAFYDEYNITDFRNKGQGLSFENFQNYLQRNYLLFEPYHINKNGSQQKVLFNYLSNNNKYISLQDLEYFFGNNDNSNNNNNGNYEYNFYEKMHNDITIFLHENFNNCQDAFKYFHEEINNNCNCNENNFITKKEFFNGISNLFPKKYQTNTIKNYYYKYFDNKNKITYSDFNYIYYNNYNYNDRYNQSLDKPSKIKTTRQDVSNMPFTSYKSPFPTEKNQKLKTPFDLDPLEKIKRLILSSKIDFKKECEYYLKYSQSNNGLINQHEFRNFIKNLNLGLTNIEIEDIINKNRITYNGYINIFEFYKYITNTDLNLSISEKNIIEILKIVKQYLYKYYNSPRLAFEMNDKQKKGYIDFEQFKKMLYELYYKERVPVPNYPVLKYVYDYVDVRKDGVIDLNEWNKVFAITESNLDVIKGPGSQYIRDWEGSEQITGIYKLISKNKKAIKDKVKLYTIRTSDNLFIQENHLIDILINVLGKIRISYPQWKMVVALGDTERNGVIDFNVFIKAIDSYANIKNSHPTYLMKNK